MINEFVNVFSAYYSIRCDLYKCKCDATHVVLLFEKCFEIFESKSLIDDSIHRNHYKLTMFQVMRKVNKLLIAFTTQIGGSSIV